MSAPWEIKDIMLSKLDVAESKRVKKRPHIDEEEIVGTSSPLLKKQKAGCHVDTSSGQDSNPYKVHSSTQTPLVTNWLPTRPPPFQPVNLTHCAECQSSDVIEDWKQGEYVCRACGLVQSATVFDTGAEWRNFDDDGEADQSRVNKPFNPLLTSDLRTSIAAPVGCGSIGQRCWKQAHISNERNAISQDDKALLKVLSSIEELCDAINVRGAVVKRSKEIMKGYFQHVQDNKKNGTTRSTPFSGNGSPLSSVNTDVVGACVYIACRNERIVRIATEIGGALGICTKSLMHMVAELGKCVKGSVEVLMLEAEEYAHYFAIRLGMNRQGAKNAQIAAMRMKQLAFCFGKSPLTLAAVVVFVLMGGTLDGYSSLANKVFSISSVTVHTIRGTYKNLLPHLDSVFTGMLQAGENNPTKTEKPHQ